MKIGDRVKWTSQANATRCTKVGTVVAIISAGERVGRRRYDFSVVPTNRHRFSFSPYSTAMTNETVVVSVKDGKTDKAKRVLYHPRTVELADDTDLDGIWPA